MEDPNQALTPSTGTYEIRLPKYKRPGEPERYRLSTARLASTPLREPPKTPVVSEWTQPRRRQSGIKQEY
jgi:hypothetical protein